MTTTRNRPADVLKGISVLMIVMVHYEWANRTCLALGFPFWADMAVPVLMIVSGYSFGTSYAKRGIGSFEEAYRPPDLLRRMVRYTVPYFFCYLAMLAADVYMNGTGLTFRKLLYRFVNGGVSYGGYYYPLMIELVLFFPLVYFLVRKYDFMGVVYCALLNYGFEILKGAYGIEELCYKYLVFRFTLLIGFGCWLAIGTYKRRTALALASTALGGLYIWLCRYRGFVPWITVLWPAKSFWAFFWIMPATGAVLRSRLTCRPLEWLGKSSYDIFLVQMLYYMLAPKLYAAVSNKGLQLFLSLAICTAGGIAYHYLETPLTDRVVRWVTERAAAWERMEG